VFPTTDLPFGKALRELMRERELTFRRLEDLTRERDPEGRGFRNGYLSQLANGNTKASVRGMELIAVALGLDPRYFVEYRAEIYRGFLDRDRVPAQQLSARLDALDDRVRGREPRTRAREPLDYLLFGDRDDLSPELQHLQDLADDA
jgi:transcriptional regulator with XRE-family HTH domain